MKKRYRLKKSDEIGKIVLKKQRISSYLYNIYYLYNKEETKIAIVAGKKCGNAVQRNYLKRTMREIVRPHLSNLNKIHAVIIAKEQTIKTTFQEKAKLLNKMLLELQERIKKNEKN